MPTGQFNRKFVVLSPTLAARALLVIEPYHEAQITALKEAQESKFVTPEQLQMFEADCVVIYDIMLRLKQQARRDGKSKPWNPGVPAVPVLPCANDYQAIDTEGFVFGGKPSFLTTDDE